MNKPLALIAVLCAAACGPAVDGPSVHGLGKGDDPNRLPFAIHFDRHAEITDSGRHDGMVEVTAPNSAQVVVSAEVFQLDVARSFVATIDGRRPMRFLLGYRTPDLGHTVLHLARHIDGTAAGSCFYEVSWNAESQLLSIPQDGAGPIERQMSEVLWWAVIGVPVEAPTHASGVSLVPGNYPYAVDISLGPTMQQPSGPMQPPSS